MNISIKYTSSRLWSEIKGVEEVVIPVGIESECVIVKMVENELVVLRHGMEYPEGGEAVYSEILEV